MRRGDMMPWCKFWRARRHRCEKGDGRDAVRRMSGIVNRRSADNVGARRRQSRAWRGRQNALDGDSGSVQTIAQKMAAVVVCAAGRCGCKRGD